MKRVLDTAIILLVMCVVVGASVTVLEVTNPSVHSTNGYVCIAGWCFRAAFASAVVISITGRIEKFK